MNYEEKRELRLQISQLLADAGLNQKAIKEMVEQEIRNKVERAFEQVIKRLNSECVSGDYISERIEKVLLNNYITQPKFEKVVKNELENRVIKVVLSDCYTCAEDMRD